MLLLERAIASIWLAVSIPVFAEAQRNSPIVSDAEAHAIVQSIIGKTSQAFNQGNRELYRELLDNDIVWMPPDQPAIRGRDAVVDWLPFDDYKIRVGITAVEFGFNGDWAVIRDHWVGTVTPSVGGRTDRLDTKSLLLLQKQEDGSWKIHHAIWNSNIPFQPTQIERM